MLSMVDVTGPRGKTGDAGIEPGTWTMSYGDADTEPVEEDVNGNADTEPGSGSGACAAPEPVKPWDNVIYAAGTRPNMGDATANVG
jgi:hypothetical protein